VITDGNLDEVDDGIEFVINTEKKYLVCEWLHREILPDRH
jgi:hypothetical protein